MSTIGAALEGFFARNISVVANTGWAFDASPYHGTDLPSETGCWGSASSGGTEKVVTEKVRGTDIVIDCADWSSPRRSRPSRDGQDLASSPAPAAGDTVDDGDRQVLACLRSGGTPSRWR